ncbi:hypothetical protein QYE76_009600, partial [Lolium multiflorum]
SANTCVADMLNYIAGGKGLRKSVLEGLQNMRGSGETCGDSEDILPLRLTVLPYLMVITTCQLQQRLPTCRDPVASIIRPSCWHPIGTNMAVLTQAITTCQLQQRLPTCRHPIASSIRPSCWHPIDTNMTVLTQIQCWASARVCAGVAIAQRAAGSFSPPNRYRSSPFPLSVIYSFTNLI